MGKLNNVDYGLAWLNGDEDYLAHHGIKGQQWGVQNGPPYPLDKSEYSKEERKAIGLYGSAKKKADKAAVVEKAYKGDKEHAGNYSARNAARSNRLRNQQSKLNAKYEEVRKNLDKESLKKVDAVVKQMGKQSVSSLNDYDVRRGKTYATISSATIPIYMFTGLIPGAIVDIAATTTYDMATREKAIAYEQNNKKRK